MAPERRKRCYICDSKSHLATFHNRTTPLNRNAVIATVNGLTSVLSKALDDRGAGVFFCAPSPAIELLLKETFSTTGSAQYRHQTLRPKCHRRWGKRLEVMKRSVPWRDEESSLRFDCPGRDVANFILDRSLRVKESVSRMLVIHVLFV